MTPPFTVAPVPDAPADGVLPWAHDPFAEAMRTGRGPLWLRRADGHRYALDIERWCAPPDAADCTLLLRCLLRGLPALDLGCGPGRLVCALQALGLPALGVDVSHAAVTRTRDTGGNALCRSLFDRLPGEGNWGTVLLADGNLGIGGDPDALLRRSAELLALHGLLLVEVEPEDVDERVTVAVEDVSGRYGPSFPWARLGARAVLRRAPRAGLTPQEAWSSGGRHFLGLRRTSDRVRATVI